MNTVTRTTHQAELSKGFDKKLLVFLKEQNALPDYWKNFETWQEADFQNDDVFNTELMFLEFDLEVEVEPGCEEYGACFQPKFNCCEIFSVKILKFYDEKNRLCQNCGSKKHTYVRGENHNSSFVCDDCNSIVWSNKGMAPEQIWEKIPSNVTLTEPLDITQFLNLSEDDKFFTDISEEIWTEIGERSID
jgi:hypothetical protein